MLRLFALIVFLLPTFANAQTYPVYGGVYVNDLANVITDEDEAIIRTQLKALFKDHGVEATVLTIDSRKTYGNSASIESFATGLFNKWAIGDAARNDGILILIARTDREMRVELGTGYGYEFDFAAGDVIDQNFLPSFRNDKYSQGIRLGTAEVIRRIALPLAGGQQMPEGPADKGWDVGKIGFFTIFVGIIGFGFRRRIADIFARLRSCPNCGRKGLHRNREVMNGASTIATGSGILTTTCDYCDYQREQNYSIPRRSSSRSSSRSSFGGGSSSGGGASGRW
ncbi:TPM domain-containing protein [Profundibacter sp.]